MSEAATLGVIRDLFGIAAVALVIGLALYGMLRGGGGPRWNCDGNVLARPYGVPDAIAALLLLAFFAASSTTAVPEPAATPAPAGPGSSAEAGLVFGMVFMLVIALGVLVYMRLRGLSPGEMFGLRQIPLLRALWFAAGALSLSYAAMLGSNYLVQGVLFKEKPWPDDSLQESVEAFRASGSWIFKFLLGFSAVAVAPFAEEVIFRGFLYGVMKRYSDRWFAMLFTSLVFACVHRHVGTAVPLFTLALGLALTYELTGSLLVPVMMHALFNALNLALLVLSHPS